MSSISLVASVTLSMLNCPVIYSLSERERAAVNMQGTVAGLNLVSPSRTFVVDDFFIIVTCNAVENYLFLRNSQIV